MGLEELGLRLHGLPEVADGLGPVSLGGCRRCLQVGPTGLSTDFLGLFFGLAIRGQGSVVLHHLPEGSGLVALEPDVQDHRAGFLVFPDLQRTSDGGEIGAFDGEKIVSRGQGFEDEGAVVPHRLAGDLAAVLPGENHADVLAGTSVLSEDPTGHRMVDGFLLAVSRPGRGGCRYKSEKRWKHPWPKPVPSNFHIPVPVSAHEVRLTLTSGNSRVRPASKSK